MPDNSSKTCPFNESSRKPLSTRLQARSCLIKGREATYLPSPVAHRLLSSHDCDPSQLRTICSALSKLLATAYGKLLSWSASASLKLSNAAG